MIVNVPPFMSSMPDLWFIIAEIGFGLVENITDAEKYCAVISSMEAEHLMVVTDILKNPPAEGRYENLKEELIKRLTPPIEETLELLRQQKMEDRTPSSYLRHLRNLIPSLDITNTMITEIWKEGLPSRLQGIMKSFPDAPIDKIGTIADNVAEVLKKIDEEERAASAIRVMNDLIKQVKDLIARDDAYITSQEQETARRQVRRTRRKSRSSNYFH